MNIAKARILNVDLELTNRTRGFDSIGISGGNRPIDGDFNHFGGTFWDRVFKTRLVLVGAVNAKGSGLTGNALDRSLALKGTEVTHYCIGAFIAKFHLDIADARPEAVSPFVVTDEI